MRDLSQMKTNTLITVCLLGTIFLPAVALAETPNPTDVYVSDTDGYHTYRIPALLTTEKGALLAFCEGRKGSRSDSGDIDLLMKRSEDGGKTWSNPQIVWDDGSNTCGNPCPVQDRTTGTIWLLLTWNDGRDKESQIKNYTSLNTRRVFVAHSDDDGRTWSTPEEITETTKRSAWGWYATGPGVGIQLERGPWQGRLIVPCDCSDMSPDGQVGYGSHIIFSDDHGQTWQLGGLIGPNTNECQIVELIDSTLMINMRNADRAKKTRAIATSRDGGLTWSKVYHDPALVEPICQASFLRYTAKPKSDQDRLLFSNPGRQDKRADLTIRMSYDEGQTWPVTRLLWANPTAYSCLTVLPDGDIACLFEGGEKHSYERIMFARFTCNWLTGTEIKP